MNYLAKGTKKGAEEAFEGLKQFSVIVDIENATADIPGTGNEVVTFTRLGDVSKFVVAAVELERRFQGAEISHVIAVGR